MAAPNFDVLGTIGWSDISRQASPEVCAALETVLEAHDGGRLTREQCLQLASAEGDDLLALIVAADELRRAMISTARSSSATVCRTMTS